jgi:hypothetical protein
MNIENNFGNNASGKSEGSHYDQFSEAREDELSRRLEELKEQFTDEDGNVKEGKEKEVEAIENKLEEINPEDPSKDKQ